MLSNGIYLSVQRFLYNVFTFFYLAHVTTNSSISRAQNAIFSSPHSTSSPIPHCLRRLLRPPIPPLYGMWLTIRSTYHVTAPPTTTTSRMVLPMIASPLQVESSEYSINSATLIVSWRGKICQSGIICWLWEHRPGQCGYTDQIDGACICFRRCKSPCP